MDRLGVVLLSLERERDRMELSLLEDMMYIVEKLNLLVFEVFVKGQFKKHCIEYVVLGLLYYYESEWMVVYRSVFLVFYKS